MVLCSRPQHHHQLDFFSHQSRHIKIERVLVLGKGRKVMLVVVPNGFCFSTDPIVCHPSSFRLVPNEHTVGNAHEGGRSGGRKRTLRKKHLPSRPSGSFRTRKHDRRVRAHEGGSSGGRKRARRRKRAGGWRAFRLTIRLVPDEEAPEE